MSTTYEVETRRERLRRQAAERQVVRDERGITAQLTELDRRLGKNVGATRERLRLELQRKGLKT